MKLAGFGPGRELGDQVEFAKQLTHHLTRVITLAELFELLHDARERLLGLRDRTVGVVLALTFETLMMFEELLPEEIRETLAGRADGWTRVT